MWNASFKLTLFGCMISICCVGFVSLDVVCDELNDCAWNVPVTMFFAYLSSIYCVIFSIWMVYDFNPACSRMNW